MGLDSFSMGIEDRDKSKSIKDECHLCGCSFVNISKHWRQSECDFPKLTEYHNNLLIGMMMGDGHCVNLSGRNPYVQWSSISWRFMEWFSRELKIFSNRVRLHMTSEEYRGGDSVNLEDCSDVYQCRTISHPDLHYLDWMNDSRKRYPNWLRTRFNSTIAKIWYVSDGNLKWKSDIESPESIRITCSNESDRIDFLLSLFEETSFKVDRIDRGDTIVFNKKNARSFLLWIGEPVPGFDYKWCNSSWEDYQKLKRVCRDNRKYLSLKQDEEKHGKDFDMNSILREYDTYVKDIGGYKIENSGIMRFKESI